MSLYLAHSDFCCDRMKGEERLIDHDRSKAEKGKFFLMYGTIFTESIERSLNMLLCGTLLVLVSRHASYNYVHETHLTFNFKEHTHTLCSWNAPNIQFQGTPF
jgi:hypothetical protein